MKVIDPKLEDIEQRLNLLLFDWEADSVLNASPWIGLEYDGAKISRFWNRFCDRHVRMPLLRDFVEHSTDGELRKMLYLIPQHYRTPEAFDSYLRKSLARARTILSAYGLKPLRSELRESVLRGFRRRPHKQGRSIAQAALYRMNYLITGNHTDRRELLFRRFIGYKRFLQETEGRSEFMQALVSAWMSLPWEAREEMTIEKLLKSEGYGYQISMLAAAALDPDRDYVPF